MVFKNIGKKEASFLKNVKVIALPMIFISSLAHAENSFLLQLGMFETREEAQRKWSEVKSANTDVVKGLNGHVVEVMLPPDNIPSYRTQVGPVNSREKAKSICKTLEARSVDCLLVESAFAASDLSPEMAADAAPVSAKTSPLEVIQPNASYTPAAVSAADNIEVSAVEPVVPPAPVVAAAPAPAPVPAKAEVAAAKDDREQNTTLETSQEEYSNPNDVKKPAFFRGSFRQRMDRKITEHTEPSTKTAAVSSAKADDEKPGFFGRLFGRTPAAAPAPAPATQTARAPKPVMDEQVLQGDVEVAEAIRVPVSAQQEAKATQAKYEPVQAEAAAPGEEGALAVDDTEGLYWAQIKYFANRAGASNFFNNLAKQGVVNLAGARAHYNHPIANQPERTSLRVGPVTSLSEVRHLCGEAKRKGLRCLVIQDETPVKTQVADARRHPSPLEVVDAGDDVPDPKPQAKEEAPAEAGTQPASGMAVQWIVLGGFPDAQEAYEYWKVLQSNFTDLQSMKPVVTGALGSRESEKFELRTGPFETDVAADRICQKLSASGNACRIAEGK